VSAVVVAIEAVVIGAGALSVVLAQSPPGDLLDWWRRHEDVWEVLVPPPDDPAQGDGTQWLSHRLDDAPQESLDVPEERCPPGQTTVSRGQAADPPHRRTGT
jgi:hypothetical protein